MHASPSRIVAAVILSIALASCTPPHKAVRHTLFAGLGRYDHAGLQAALTTPIVLPRDLRASLLWLDQATDASASCIETEREYAMGVQEIADQLKPKVESSGFDRSVKFDTGLDGVILIDGSTSFTLPALTPDPLPTGETLTLRASALVIPELDPNDFRAADLRDRLDRLSSNVTTFTR